MLQFSIGGITVERNDVNGISIVPFYFLWRIGNDQDSVERKTESPDLFRLSVQFHRRFD